MHLCICHHIFELGFEFGAESCSLRSFAPQLNVRRIEKVSKGRGPAMLEKAWQGTNAATATHFQINVHIYT